MKRPLLRRLDNFLGGTASVFLSPPLLMFFTIFYIVCAIVTETVLYAVYALLFIQFNILTKLDEKDSKRLALLNDEFSSLLKKSKAPTVRTHKASTTPPTWSDDPT